MRDATAQLRSATRRAKSDVANKLISMFLHELSRRISEDWPIRVDSEEYEQLVRGSFNNRCPYCSSELTPTSSVIEHLDGMNRYRAGLHVPGNVLVACKRCNCEKRRDDALKILKLANSGWESFLSHDGTSCAVPCATCGYWSTIWQDQIDRRARLAENLVKLRLFRTKFPEFVSIVPALMSTLPTLLTKLYSDCQVFAENEIKSVFAGLPEKLYSKGRPKGPTPSDG